MKPFRFLLVVIVAFFSCGVVLAQTDRIDAQSHSGLGHEQVGDGNYGLPSKQIMLKMQSAIDSLVFLSDTSVMQYSQLIPQGVVVNHHIYANDPLISLDSLQRLYPDIKLIGFEKKTYKAGVFSLSRTTDSGSGNGLLWALVGGGILVGSFLVLRRSRLRKAQIAALSLLLVATAVNAQTERIAAGSHSGKPQPNAICGGFGIIEEPITIDSLIFINDTTVIQCTNIGRYVIHDHLYANNPLVSIDSLKKIYPDTKLVGFEKKTYKAGMFSLSRTAGSGSGNGLLWALVGGGILVGSLLVLRRSRLRKAHVAALGLLLVATIVNAQTERIAAGSHSGKVVPVRSAHTLGGPAIMQIDSLVFINDTTVMQCTNIGNYVIHDHLYANNPMVSADSLQKIYPGIKLVGFEKKTYKASWFAVKHERNAGLPWLLGGTALLLGVVGYVFRKRKKREVVAA